MNITKEQLKNLLSKVWKLAVKNEVIIGKITCIGP